MGLWDPSGGRVLILKHPEQFCISEEGYVYKIHRLLLASVSPYFKTLFTTNLNRGENKEILKENIPGVYIELILDYAYTGTCEVSSSTVERLLPIADLYGILGIVKACCSFLEDQLSIENCIGIYLFSKSYSCIGLESKCLNFILKYFYKIIFESQELIDLSVNDLHFFLSHDDLNIMTEEIIIVAIHRWLEKNPIVRQYYVPSLLACLRYGFFREDLNGLYRIPFISNDEACLKVIRPAIKVATTAKSIDNKQPYLRPRTPQELIFAFGGWSDGTPNNCLETYDIRADKWLLCVQTNLPYTAYHGICSLGHDVYVIGGMNGLTHENSVWKFSPVQKEWTERACMFNARCFVSVSTLDGYIYAIGGSNGRVRMKSAERYSPEIDKWQMIASMKKRRSDASAAACNDKIYVVGGFNGYHILKSAEVYDPRTDQWCMLSNMNNLRSGLSIIAYKDAIYALGGYDGYTRLKSVEMLDLMRPRSQWQQMIPMSTRRCNFSAVILENLMFVIGGYNGSRTIPQVECYDWESQTWYEASPMNISRSALGAVVLTGLPNTKEYSYASENIGNNDENSYQCAPTKEN